MLVKHIVYRVHRMYAVCAFVQEMTVDDHAYAADVDSRMDNTAEMAAVAGGVWLQLIKHGNDVLCSRVTLRDKGTTMLSAGRDVVAASPCFNMVEQLISDAPEERRIAYKSS